MPVYRGGATVDVGSRSDGAPPAGPTVNESTSLYTLADGSEDGEIGRVVAPGLPDATYLWFTEAGKSPCYLPEQFFTNGVKPSKFASTDAAVDTKVSLAAAEWDVPTEDAQNTITRNGGTFELRAAAGGGNYAYFLANGFVWTSSRIGFALKLKVLNGTGFGRVYAYVARAASNDLVMAHFTAGAKGRARLGITGASTAKGLFDLDNVAEEWVYGVIDYSALQGACQLWRADDEIGKLTATESQNGEPYAANEIAIVVNYGSGEGGQMDLSRAVFMEL